MSVIFPGNYVAKLNAYRDQGVYAIPGVEFYQAIGAAVVYSSIAGAGSLAVEVQSPDLRQDDKPRLNKALAVPAGAVVYRTSINTVNLSASGTDTVAVDGLTNTSLETSLAAVAGKFPMAGAASSFDGFSTVSTEAGGATISVAHSGGLDIVDTDSCAAVLVEVCYYVPAGGPDSDDVSLPYKTEAGQGY